MRIVRLIESSGLEKSTMSMAKDGVERALWCGDVTTVVVEVNERDVPKAERKSMLDPSEAHLADLSAKVVGVFASSECTFAILADGKTFGCGLNGDGQVGLGFL